MDKLKSVVIAVVTFYKTMEELRFKLACQTIGNAIAHGHAVVVVDGSPNPEVAKKFVELGAKVFPELHRGLGPSKRQSFFHASEIASQEGYAAVLACEAEKDLAEFVPELLDPVLTGEATVVVPERTAEGWNSYPEFQRQTEREANNVFLEETRISLDIMFGPVLFTKRTARHFVIQDPKNWGFVDGYAQHLGVLQSWFNATLAVGEVVPVEIEFRYPAEQRAEEEGALTDAMKAKRLQQRDSLIASYKSVGEKHRKMWPVE